MTKEKIINGLGNMARTSLALLALTLTAGTALAQSYGAPSGGGSFKGALYFGYDATISGDFHGSASGDFAGLPVEIKKGSFSDIYSAPLRYGAELSYSTGNLSEFFGKISYARASAKTTNIGTAATAFPVTATFDDYREYEVSGGYRKYFRMPSTALTPYLAGSAGIKRVSEIRADIAVPDAGITLRDSKFYDASWVPTLGVDLGFLYPVSGQFAVGVEGGVHYQFALSGNDDTLSDPAVGSNLGDLNEGGSRWSFPMSVKGMVKF